MAPAREDEGRPLYAPTHLRGTLGRCQPTVSPWEARGGRDENLEKRLSELFSLWPLRDVPQTVESGRVLERTSKKSHADDGKQQLGSSIGEKLPLNYPAKAG